MEILLYTTMAITLFFSFWNGFTDAANAIATVVATRVLRPLQAVALSAVGNFIGMFFGVAVATTIGKGIVRPDVVTMEFVIAAILGGLIWDVSTYYLALPVSESHVLIGGLVGAGIAAGGLGAVQLATVVDKVVIPMISSPTLAFLIGLMFTTSVIWVFRGFPPKAINKHFSRLQIVSSLFFSVTHGTNDAQKAMGVITALLVSYGYLATFEVPLWVILASHLAISSGTFFGGWRIVKTMGLKITKLRPYQGFCAETSGAVILASTAYLGFPVSTTHAIAGSIMGVGSTIRFSAVRWGVARRIVWAWILTMPMSALFSFITYRALKLILF